MQFQDEIVVNFRWFVGLPLMMMMMMMMMIFFSVFLTFFSFVKCLFLLWSHVCQDRLSLT